MYSERHILEFAQSKMLSGFEVAVAILLSSDIESRRPGKILAVGSDKMSCGDDRDFLDVKNQIESVLKLAHRWKFGLIKRVFLSCVWDDDGTRDPKRHVQSIRFRYRRGARY